MNEPRRITERYHLEKRISSKAASSVFRAADTLSGATVAVKLFNTGDLDRSREAFEAHLGALREVRHPALPRILDFGRTNAGSLFLVTEYFDGDDLGDLVDIPPARVLALLLQLAEGLEAVAARGLSLRNLSAGNVRLVKAPVGEQAKILGLGSGALLPAAVPDTDRTDLRAFAQLAAETLGLSVRDDEGTMAVALPLEVAGALTESERLREVLEAGLRDHPGTRPPDWTEVRQTLRTALFGTSGHPSAAPAVSDDTIAVSRTGATLAPPATQDYTTRVFLPDDLATDLDGTMPTPLPPVPPPLPPPAPAGPMRIPLRDIEEAPPPAGTLRFPSPPPHRPAEHEATMPRRSSPSSSALPNPTPLPIPPPVPISAGARPVGASAALPAAPPQPIPPPPAPQIAPPPAVKPSTSPAASRPGMPPRRLALLIGLPVAGFLVLLGLVAWMSRHSAEPQPVEEQTSPQPTPGAAPLPPASPSPKSPTATSIHPQILLAEEALSASDPQKARSALAAISADQVARFTAEEKDRYQRALDALTPLQSQEWAERLKRGLATGDTRLLRAAVASPPAAATLTPEQKKGLARARKILDLDKRLTRAQREKDHSEALQQASLLLAELPGNARAQKARSDAAGALLAESDAHAAQAELDAALAALEHLREGWPDHPGLAERFDRLRAERRADEQMEEALAAAARAEKAEHPREGLEALDRVRPNERYAARFQQARERLQAQLAQLDSNPPQITVASTADPFEKGATVTVRLRITDDQTVESAEAWVRPEGGRFAKASLRHLGGSDYELVIGPDLHQNKNIDFYVTAADSSGHKGSLGNLQRPQKIKRKRWFSPR